MLVRQQFNQLVRWSLALFLAAACGRSNLTVGGSDEIVRSPKGPSSNSEFVVNANGPYVGTVGVSVAFSGTATAAGVSSFTYLWDFGDSSTAAAAATSHTYSATGYYTVKLTATDPTGHSASATTTAQVTSPVQGNLRASASATPSNGPAPLTVSFTASAVDGTSPYAFSWAFGDGATGRAANASHAYQQAGTFTATVTATDALGQRAQASVTVVASAPPPPGTLQASASATPVAGNAPLSVNFTASAMGGTSPYMFSWDFGDSSATATGLTASHTYQQPGSYTVKLTATDSTNPKQSASAPNLTITANAPPPPPPPPGPVATGPKPPSLNCGISSAGNGNWSNPATWDKNRVPGAGDQVCVGHVVTFDVTESDSAPLASVDVKAAGVLQFSTSQSTQIVVTNLRVEANGNLTVGTPGNPVPSNFTAAIHFADTPLNTNADPYQWGTGFIATDGNVTMMGSNKTCFATVSAEPHQGDTQLSFAQPVSGWAPGDLLLLPDSRQLSLVGAGEFGANYVAKWEEATIQTVSANGTQVTLGQALKFNHRGGYDTAGVLDYLPDAMNLSRNIVISSVNPLGTRGYVYLTGKGSVDIENVRFRELGRTKNSPSDNTTADAQGNITHVGTNVSRRGPVILDHLIGPANAPGGVQFKLIGNSWDDQTFTDPQTKRQVFKGAIAISDSHYGDIERNVIFNVSGAGIWTMIGNETGNFINQNMVSGVSGINGDPPDTGWKRADQIGDAPEDVGNEGTAFYFRGVLNRVTNNVAGGPFASYGFTVFQQYVGNNGYVPTPNAPGDDTSVTGQFTMTFLHAQPLAQFEGNKAYGAGAAGMTMWWVGTLFHTAEGPAGTIKNFVVWNTHDDCYFGYETSGLIIDGLKCRGDPNLLSGLGLGWNDYFNPGTVIQNSDIQGRSIGFQVGTSSGNGSQTIQDSYMNNWYNIEDGVPWTSGYTSKGMDPILVYVKNVTFGAGTAPPPGAQGPSQNIVVSYPSPLGDVVESFIVSNQLFVTDYNGVAGDNFQVFALEQNQNSIVPQSTYNSDGTPRLDGSPVAGLTNLQNQPQYRIAGGITRCTTQRSTIHGYACP